MAMTGGGAQRNSGSHGINSEERCFLGREKDDGGVYLGTVVREKRYGEGGALIMNSSISAISFLKYDWNEIARYLSRLSCRPSSGKLHLLRLHITADGVYSVVVLTFWIRWIQRAWRRVFREKQLCRQRRSSWTSRSFFEVHGKYPRDCVRYPSVHGMLAVNETAGE